MLYIFQLFQLPFYVALDHKEKNIVVAIRGTLSIEVSNNVQMLIVCSVI